MAQDSIERIKLLRKTLGLTQNEFASRLGFTGANPAATVSNWESGKTQPTRLYNQISEVFNVSLNWLLTGEGDMFTTLPLGQISPISNSIKIENIFNEIQSIFIDSSIVPANSNSVRYCTLDCDTMSPTINSGDIIFIELNAPLQIDSTYLLNIDGTYTLRRLSMTCNGLTTLTCDNKIYEPITINMEIEKIKFFGRVIGVFRRFGNQPMAKST